MFTPLALTLAMVVVAAIGVSAWLPAQTPTGKLCCVAGTYRGSQTPDPLPNCPVPKAETFSMTISQALGCGADVWGTITSAAGGVNHFKGTLRRGPRGCCVLAGSFSDPARPGHVVKFTGTLCRKAGKWAATGTFTEVNSGDPCKTGGVWKIAQN
jgi:hypothetical protein